MNNENTAIPSDSAGEVTSNTGNGHKVDAYLIPFNQIEISKWNRSRDITLDAKYIEELAADIKRNGLLHPVTLVKTANGTGYRIVAGANRVAALRKLRGDNSGLKQTEFKLREDMTEEDQNCLALSLSENRHRRASSVYETAVYAYRLINEENIEQGKLGRMLKLDRSKVNRLIKLVGCYDQLPETWRKDLCTSSTMVRGESGIFITFTHWYEAAGQIQDGEVTPEVAAKLNEAYKKNWSTRELRNELRKTIEGSPAVEGDGETAGGETTGEDSSDKPSAPANPVELLKSASRYLRQVSALVKVEHADEAGSLVGYADGVDNIVEILAAERAAKKAEKEAKLAAEDGQQQRKVA